MYHASLLPGSCPGRPRDSSRGGGRSVRSKGARGVPTIASSAEEQRNPGEALVVSWQILLEDGPLLAINKPAGLLTLGGGPDVPTLERQVKQHLKERFHKPGNVYLGIPHRLDRPVSGVIVFARNSKAAARLAEEFRERRVSKTYLAVVEGVPEADSGRWTDWLVKVPEKAVVAAVSEPLPGAREAVLDFVVRKTWESPAGVRSLLELAPQTGRMHQIRVQLASRGRPVVGDVQYGGRPWRIEAELAGPGSAEPTAVPPSPRDLPIALHAARLTLRHPIRYEPVTIEAPLPAEWATLGPRLD